MTEKYAIENTYNALKAQLRDYIQTQYFGESNLLINAEDDIFSTQHAIAQTPFLESNPVYETSANGIAEAKIPVEVKEALLGMSEAGLGVFKHPYVHQIRALEDYYAGHDILVSSGTGSGKTECFMWPILANLFSEAKKSPETWKVRGIRAILLYPMNALVSDQIGRLRSMIGNLDGTFHPLFKRLTGGKAVRYPQFGMYTGRTPYPGVQNPENDKELAKTLTHDILEKDGEYVAALKGLGRYPAKKDLSAFVAGLRQTSHNTSVDDAELMTRQEMQHFCPDILVTNYVMLQFMLIRDMESCIWQATKEWLDADSENRLQIVIDEAHMYHGSAGGEVSLLLRRLMHRLGISRDKLRFILTSASIPSESEKEKKTLQKFLCDMTTADENSAPFSMITGIRAQVIVPDATEIPIPAFLELRERIDDYTGDERKRCDALKALADTLHLAFPQDTSQHSLEIWLYSELLKFAPVQRLIQESAGNATSVDVLAEKVFPMASESERKTCLQILLAIMPLAKNNEGIPLFPARLHIFLRGLPGIYACTNPKCPHHHSGDGVTLGQLFLEKGSGICPHCNGRLYELFSERRCGALFLRGYMNDKIGGPIRDLWDHPGERYSVQLKEVHLYLIPEGQKDLNSKPDIHIGWLDPFTGSIDFEEGCEHDGRLKVAYSSKVVKSKPDQLTFSSCPKCKKSLQSYQLTGFTTLGNEPFFNVVATQLKIQPPTLHDVDLTVHPNEGRKVLVFSDSRQQAAKLAKDMSRAADDDAARAVFVLAAKKLEEWSKQTTNQISLDLLYPVFLETAINNNLNFFYGASGTEFEKHLAKIRNAMAYSKKYQEPINYLELRSEFEHVPELYYEQLLKQLCFAYHAITPLGFGWLVPKKKSAYDIFKEEAELPDFSEEEFHALFAAWANFYCLDSFALGSSIPDEVRYGAAAQTYVRCGIPLDKLYKMPKPLRLAYEKHFSPDDAVNEAVLERIQRALAKAFLESPGDDRNSYLNLSLLALKTDDGRKWHRCLRCGGIFPYALNNHCAICGSDSIELMDEHGLDRNMFWRKDVLAALDKDNKEPIRTINTEEHTAQLSYKDQRDNTWSTTEQYEMRFQNVLGKEERPIDVLSCTTTMEVGIDIGSLLAISMRNVPPMRENYQQRAGRAGRRGSSLSTIVTYAQNGPHDSWYFAHPEIIISGKPRMPWIDAHNPKLIHRHLNLLILTSFLTSKNLDMSVCDTTKFYYSELLDEFYGYLDGFSFTDAELESILPPSDRFLIDEVVLDLREKIQSIKRRMDMDQTADLYANSSELKAPTLLDHFSSEGIIPTYSFPQNIVGFNIENPSTGKLIQKPERSLDIALNEYAPGKVIVVNKMAYKAGGIYDPISKYRKGYYERPARWYFENTDYVVPLYQCKSKVCDWIGPEKPEDGRCPFCGEEVLESKRLLRPWGFAPKAAQSIGESWGEVEYSYADDPSYFSKPIEDDLVDTSYPHIRYANRSDKITIINRGIGGLGFRICKDCGDASVIKLGDDEGGSQNDRRFKNKKPFIPIVKNKSYCKHDDVEDVYLGYTFVTDMVVFELSLNPSVIDTDEYPEWLDSGIVSLTEALHLAASRVLDVDFNDLTAGHRMHRGRDFVNVDIYLYDSLSSGAGYASGLLSMVDELFQETLEILHCGENCDSACHSCLKHYWNQRVHDKLDRFAAMDILGWVMKEELPGSLDIATQQRLLEPVIERLRLDGLTISMTSTQEGISISANNRTIVVEVYPVMLNWQSKRGIHGIPDRLLTNALPMAYEKIFGWLKKAKA